MTLRELLDAASDDAKSSNYLKALDEVRAERDAALARAEAAEAQCATLEAALRLASSYMEDALEQGGMTDELEANIHADIAAVSAALAATQPAEGQFERRLLRADIKAGNAEAAEAQLQRIKRLEAGTGQ